MTLTELMFYFFILYIEIEVHRYLKGEYHTKEEY